MATVINKPTPPVYTIERVKYGICDLPGCKRDNPLYDIRKDMRPVHVYCDECTASYCRTWKLAFDWRAQSQTLRPTT